MLSAAGRIWKNMTTNISSLQSGRDNGDGSGSFQPSLSDVLVTKAMLQHVGRLPLELADAIIDLAEYWPHTHVELDAWRETGNAIIVPPRSVRNIGNNKFLCRTPPLGFVRPPRRANKTAAYAVEEPEPLPATDGLCSDEDVRGWLPPGHAPALEHPCRKIVFTLVSRDQGWANNIRDKGSYRGSYSWFDVGLERYGPRTGEDQGNDDEDADDAESTDGQEGTASVPPTAALYTVRPEVEQAVAPPGAPPSAEAPKWQFAFPLLPGADRIQSNRVATRDWTEHKIVWSWTDGRDPPEPFANPSKHSSTAQEQQPSQAYDSEDNEPPEDDEPSEDDESLHPLEALGRGAQTGDGEFVRNLRVGDVVTVWAKARFPGWVNMVQRVQVDVYWAV